MKSFYNRISYKTSAEIMVWSFLVASFLGGTALYISEYNREVLDVVPTIQQVTQTTVTNNETTVVPVVNTTAIAKKGESYVDSLFMAVSALCVTGLSSTDFAEYTLPGQIILMILIQIGGLGVIVFTSFFALLIVK
jgi:Trk-type K+ transport system membrane component